ncbi:MAG: DUF4124 domain-containing protein [Roseateles sp.]|nr:MAG: DUF4124 domain-containing protein [Roseateles sp.]
MQRKALFAALLTCALVGTAHAQWKWRDARGNLQYSDLPPPAGTPEKDILQRPASATRLIVVAPPGSGASAAASAPARVASGPSKAEQDAAAREQQQQKQQAARQKEEEQRLAAQRRDNCARAQASMRDLQSGIRLTRTNEQGERVFLDDSQRQAELERTRQLLTSECR